MADKKLAEPGSVEPEGPAVVEATVEDEVVRFAGRKFDPDQAARSAESLAAAAQEASNNRVNRIANEAE